MIARALCGAELEALARVVERDEGDFSGAPTNPLIINAQPPVDKPHPVSLKKLWREYVETRTRAGFMRSGSRRQEPVIANLSTFLKHDDARRISKTDIMAWREHLMQSLSPKTVSDVYLSTIRSLLNWAVDNDRLPDNAASKVKQPKPRRQLSREKGYTEAEATTVLKASTAYKPTIDKNGRPREATHLVAAKRWAPLICAFTGARVSEITQLRKEDLRQVDSRWVIRITPDAGSLKVGDYRDVPLHEQIVELGFVDFVHAAKIGPLFHNASDPRKYTAKAKHTAGKVGAWLQTQGLVPDGVWPNYGWRHRVKTQWRELGASDRVADVIQGHAGRTASDDYGDVTLKTKIAAIDLLPRYDLNRLPAQGD